jgi:E3 ubiquitin-protein ligase RNF216
MRSDSDLQDEMIQCPDAHLFCSSCVTKYCETLLGSHNPTILCMDQSGCKFHFPESELQRLLTPKLMSLYDRVKQQKEIEAAGIENLEECPFCEYKVVIDNPEEKLFRCENANCMSMTCRSCKKAVSRSEMCCVQIIKHNKKNCVFKDHLPKSCKGKKIP